MNHIPIIRFGKIYKSLEIADVTAYNNKTISQISLADPLLFKNDIIKNKEQASKRLRKIKISKIIEWIKAAGDIFANVDVEISGIRQSPNDYCTLVMQSTGLPRNIVMDVLSQIKSNLLNIEHILIKQSRQKDLSVFDTNIRFHDTFSYGWTPSNSLLATILPSNHPIVNMTWLIAFAMKYPVAIRPSISDPYTPLRLIASLISAGADPAFFSYYPMEHNNVFDFMNISGKSIIFGNANIKKKYSRFPFINTYGPGNSKIIIGKDYAEEIDNLVEIITKSSLYHSGRACINVSGIITFFDSKKLAEAIAERFYTIKAMDLQNPKAILGAIKNKKMLNEIIQKIDIKNYRKGVIDLTSDNQITQSIDDQVFLQPKCYLCNDSTHSLFGIELPFPFLTITQANEENLDTLLNNTLACSIISDDKTLRHNILLHPGVDKVFCGMIEPYCMDYGAPHNGFLSDFLYKNKTFKEP